MVYKCTAQLCRRGVVAVKQIPKQTNIQDRCVLTDVFSEIACMDMLRFEAHICQIYDYGVDQNGYWMVLKYYDTTLKKWRLKLRGSIQENLPLLLGVYKQVLKAVACLHGHGIVHYDIKLDNVLVNLKSRRKLDVSLADFGESSILQGPDVLECKNRGTEILKPPEMLLLEKAANRNLVSHDRRRRIGTSEAADIWALGLLVWELLSGDYLFEGLDFSTFWARVTGVSGEPVLQEEQAALLPPAVANYIRSLLVREPSRRPTIVGALRGLAKLSPSATT